MSAPMKAVEKVVKTAVRFARIRGKYRKMLDSKSAESKAIEKQKEKLIKVTNELEVAALQFDALYRRLLLEKPNKKVPIPWLGIYNTVKAGVNLIEGVRGPREPVGRVIDVKSEDVKND